MDRKFVLMITILVFFLTFPSPHPTCTGYDRAPKSHFTPTVKTSNTIWVPDDHEKIQWAIGNATAGDTIFVRAGTYYEHLILDKPLTLVGENKHNTTIDGNGTGTLIQINRVNNITVRGFTLQHGELGIWLWYSSGNILLDNIASNNSYGFFIGYSSDNLLSGNILLGNQYGIYLSYADNNTLTSNVASNGTDGIYLWRSDNNAFTGNAVSSNWDGIYLSYSNNNAFASNVASNNQYGIYLYYSASNAFSCNNASSNSYGMYLWRSDSNAFNGNIVFSNIQYGIFLSYSRGNNFSSNTATHNQYGVYFDGSWNNILYGNVLSSNNPDGILLYHSEGNVLSGNDVSDNQCGIHISDSDNNLLSGNVASNNLCGVQISYSRDNILTGNIIINNSRYGISLTSSRDNRIFHNNLINNTESSNSTDSANSWDNGFEGNYWSNYDGADADGDGIGDKPYIIDERSQDNYPLMAMFLQFSVVKGNQSYSVNVVCNSAISNFLFYNLNDGAYALSFKVNGGEGAGFCRICVPHALVAPPYTVTVNYDSPRDLKVVYANGTHTWLYFTYYHPNKEVMIRHAPYSQQLTLSQWAILGLTLIVVVLLSISIHYYRMFNKQQKIIKAYERELGSFPLTHSERARARFVGDVIKREEKIESFKRKYGIKIQPANSLEDLMEKMGVQKDRDRVKR